ncbi:MAG: hypothetical protein M0Z84_02780 [Gammaproteobacteria bacterium]|nr:hypothetical protein [Gammaproteobacteria bacterium]
MRYINGNTVGVSTMFGSPLMSHVVSADSSASRGAGKWQIRVRDVRSWIATLPLAGSIPSAERLYQAISDLNRRELDPGQRLDLMELYAQPVASVSTALQAPWAYLRLPMAPKARRTAEFLRNLHGEMACGYQCVLRDLVKAHHAWDRKATVCVAAARAIQQLGEVLLRSYQVYMPAPAGVWREIHGLYRLVEERGLLDHPVSRAQQGSGIRKTVRNTYTRVVALGLCGPYQLPQNECLRVNAFLRSRADLVSLAPRPGMVSPGGQFLIDLSADTPARAIPKGAAPASGPNLRVLSTFGLARAAHDGIERLRDGQVLSKSEMGFDCSDAGCLDVLWLMVRFWGAGAYRLYPRRSTRDSELSLCVGLKALHFFSGGRRTTPMLPAENDSGYPDAAVEESSAGDSNEAFIDLESGAGFPELEAPIRRSRPVGGQRYEFRQWMVCDESAGGLALVHRGGDVSVHVGELLGIRGPDADAWSVGVVRWIKSPETARVDLGVKMLAPVAIPVMVKPAEGAGRGGYIQALQLPEIPAVGQPSTLLLERGLTLVDRDLELRDARNGGRLQRVRILKVIRRTASFEQAVVVPAAGP